MAGGTFGSKWRPVLIEPTLFVGGTPMHTHSPTMLRKMAATYRARAITEPEQAITFLAIAEDMESHADQIEAESPNPRTRGSA